MSAGKAAPAGSASSAKPTRGIFDPELLAA
jgi:hypothetical protein